MASLKTRPEHRCRLPGCDKSYTRRPDLQRHEKDEHNPRKLCPIPGCRYKVKRQVRLNTHMETCHGLSREDTITILEAPEASVKQTEHVLGLPTPSVRLPFDLHDITSQANTQYPVMDYRPSQLANTGNTNNEYIAEVGTFTLTTNSTPVDNYIYAHAACASASDLRWQLRLDHQHYPLTLATVAVESTTEVGEVPFPKLPVSKYEQDMFHGCSTELSDPARF